ncbi:MAG: response regulator [Pseudomonadota bacterium]
MALSHALVVDDSKSARFALKKLLEEQSLQVSLAASGEEALDFLKKESVDVIFMDHTMPGMDGLEAVSAIKANPDTATIPVMMYTTREGEVYVGQARALGAVGVLPKNVQPHQLFEMLAKLGLVKDRRRAPRPESDVGAGNEAVAMEVAGSVELALDKQASGIALQNVVQRILDDQHMTLRSDILRSQRSFAKEVAREIVLEQARAEESLAEEVDEPASSNVSGFITGALVAAVLVLGFLTWQFKSDRDQMADRLAVAGAGAPAQTAATEETGLDEELALATESLDLLRDRAWSSLAWAVNGQSSVGLLQPAFGDDLSVRIDELLRRLESLEFEGEVRLISHLGRFCMMVDELGDYVLPPPGSTVGQCDYVGHPFETSARVSDRLSIPFARLYQQYGQQYGQGPIQLSLVALTGTESAQAYPYPGSGAMAADWNRVAELNNRVLIEILPTRDET